MGARPHDKLQRVVVITDAVGRQDGRERVERRQPEAFEELPGRAVLERAARRLAPAELFDETSRHERVDGLVAVDAADRFHLGARHRLAVRDDRERFECRRREPQPVSAEIGRDVRGHLGGGRDLPIVALVLEAKPGAAVPLLELGERLGHGLAAGPDRLRELRAADRLLGDEQDRLHGGCGGGARHSGRPSMRRPFRSTRISPNSSSCVMSMTSRRYRSSRAMNVTIA